MDSIILPSGHLLEIGTPDFDHARRLYKAMARELVTVDIQLDSLDMRDLATKDISAFKNVILVLVGSDAVEACVMLCATKSMLDGQKISMKTFEPDEMREDFLPVVWEVVKLALRPFGKSLGSLFSTQPAPGSKSQK